MCVRRSIEGRKKNVPGMNVSVYSTVYVCWQCLQVFIFTEHFRAIVDVEQCSKCARGEEEEEKIKGG